MRFNWVSIYQQLTSSSIIIGSLVVMGEEASGRVNGTGDPFSKNVGRSSKNGFLMSFGAETHSSSNSYDDRKTPDSYV